jgi:hypothetical protein
MDLHAAVLFGVHFLESGCCFGTSEERQGEGLHHVCAWVCMQLGTQLQLQV